MTVQLVDAFLAFTTKTVTVEWIKENQQKLNGVKDK